MMSPLITSTIQAFSALPLMTTRFHCKIQTFNKKANGTAHVPHLPYLFSAPHALLKSHALHTTFSSPNSPHNPFPPNALTCHSNLFIPIHSNLYASSLNALYLLPAALQPSLKYLISTYLYASTYALFSPPSFPRPPYS
ncbi:hypothetical protein BM1374166_01933 [Bartonella tribocorum]|nr:hypothetical protein BM1374166_01933 [Bartonella tribocorum]